MCLSDLAFIHSHVTFFSVPAFTHYPNLLIIRIYSLPAFIQLLLQPLFYQLIILLLSQGCRSTDETSFPSSFPGKQKELEVIQRFAPG